MAARRLLSSLVGNTAMIAFSAGAGYGVGITSVSSITTGGGDSGESATASSILAEVLQQLGAGFVGLRGMLTNDGGITGSGSHTEPSESEGLSAHLHALTAAVSALAERQAQQSSTLVISPSESPLSSIAWSFLQAIGGTSASLGLATYTYCKWKGMSLSDLAYVTSKEFKAVGASLSKRIRMISKALASTKRELLERLHGLEDKVEECGARTEERIKQEADSIRADIRAVDGSQAALQDMMAEMSNKVHVVESQTRFSSEGIHLLCSVLDREIAAATGKRLASNTPSKRSRALERLEKFTRTAHQSDFFQSRRGGPPLLVGCEEGEDNYQRETDCESMVDDKEDAEVVQSSAHNMPSGPARQDREIRLNADNFNNLYVSEDEETPPTDFTRRKASRRYQLSSPNTLTSP